VSLGGSAASADYVWLVDGYRRAHARFTDTKDQRERKERFVPLFETLNWVVAIMDSEPKFWRDEIVVALRFARNSVHHQLADALEPRDVPFPQVATNQVGGSRIIGPPVVLDWFWIPADQLPKPPLRFINRGYRVGRKAYEDRLEGEPVAHALAHLDMLL
jgi:hypothetical protein